MPKPAIKCNAALLDPLEAVTYQLQDSVTLIQFSIFRDEDTGNELIQCDLCGFFVSLTSTRHTSYMTGHRGKDQCKKYARKRIEATNNMKDISTVHDMFQGSTTLQLQLPDAQIGALSNINYLIRTV